MKKSPRTYNRFGHVSFPIYAPEYIDLAYLRPMDAGILTVRLLVEDTTVDQHYTVQAGAQAAHDDFLVGSDGHPSPKAAHEYFSEPRKIIENLLLGAIDWTGCRLADKAVNVVDLWRATTTDLDPLGRKAYDRIRDEMFPGCSFWLITSLDKKKSTIEALVHEIARLGYAAESVPRTEQSPVICSECKMAGVVTIKPFITSTKIGWKKVRKGVWLCAEHNVKPTSLSQNSPPTPDELKIAGKFPEPDFSKLLDGVIPTGFEHKRTAEAAIGRAMLSAEPLIGSPVLSSSETERQEQHRAHRAAKEPE